jgi:replicative DNA helicase
VLFVYREEYYVKMREPKFPMRDDPPEVHTAHEEWSKLMAPVHGLAEVIISKQRHGATGNVKVRFESNITRFSDYVEDAYLAEPRG